MKGIAGAALQPMASKIEGLARRQCHRNRSTAHAGRSFNDDTGQAELICAPCRANPGRTSAYYHYVITDR